MKDEKSVCISVYRWPLNHYPSGMDFSCNRWFYKISAQHWPKCNQTLTGLKTNKKPTNPRTPTKKPTEINIIMSLHKNTVPGLWLLPIILIQKDMVGNRNDIEKGYKN